MLDRGSKELGIDFDAPKFVVEVLPDEDKCVLDAVAMPCAKVVAYIREEKKVATSRPIELRQHEGTAPHDVERVSAVEEALRAAGYKSVTGVFYLESRKVLEIPSPPNSSLDGARGG